MHFAICYVSTASPNLYDSQIKDILQFSRDKNNHNQITGILLYSQGNFFQVLEGEKEHVSTLFNTIKKDDRHYDVMTIFRKEVAQPVFNEYEADFLSLDAAYREKDYDLYLSHVRKLNPSIQKPVEYIMQQFS